MKRQACWFIVLVAGTFLSLANDVWAAEPVTTITIPKMDCGGCAKKIAAKLTEVLGVAKVEYSVETRTVTVTAKPQSVLSPRTLWEAVEKADKKPTKLAGPSGTFTEKPKT